MSANRGLLLDETLSGERGITLMEVLFCVLFTSIMAMGLTSSTLTSYRSYNNTLHNSYAMQLALQRLEQLAAVSPDTLSNATDSDEPEVLMDNMSFRRVTDVTINADRSRTVEVTVTSNSAKLNTSVTISDTFTMWGNR